MILRIKHKGLREYWERGVSRGLNQHWLRKIDRVMNALEHAKIPDDMDFPGLRLHRLKGDYDGFFAVNVSGNWRIVFRFRAQDTTDIDLVDYH